MSHRRSKLSHSEDLQTHRSTLQTQIFVEGKESKVLRLSIPRNNNPTTGVPSQSRTQPGVLTQLGNFSSHNTRLNCPIWQGVSDGVDDLEIVTVIIRYGSLEDCDNRQ